MKIFDWAKELEKIYEELLEEAKNQNLNEIEELKVENEKLIEESLQHKQKLVKKALNSVSNDADKEIMQFKENLTRILEKWEQDYNKNRLKIINDIIRKLGLDFSA
jgi:vacuolar-type H+-ATPase subunit H